MNASQSTLLRALHGLACSALLLTVFQACSGDETSTPTPPAGPASIEITGIALGNGFYDGSEASSVLACDKKIGVNVQLTNWTLLGPGRCSGALQCGQLRVTLIEKSSVDGQTEMETDVLQIIAAGNGVSLDGDAATPPVHGGEYAVRAELIDDAGHPYIELDGGNGTARQDFKITEGECPASGGAGGNPAGGTAGVGGSAGIAGVGGSAGIAGVGGTAGVSGTAGSAGLGGTAGVGETAGTAGVSGTPGLGGAAGLGGTSGISGIAGVGGSETAGTAGTTAGTAGGN